MAKCRDRVDHTELLQNVAFCSAGASFVSIVVHSL